MRIITDQRDFAAACVERWGRAADPVHWSRRTSVPRLVRIRQHVPYCRRASACSGGKHDAVHLSG